MIIKVNTKIGNTTYQFEFDEKDEMEGLHKAAVLGNPPKVCDECKNDIDFRLESNKDKEGNTYVNVVCDNPDCQAKAKLGQYKVGGYFFHKFKKYIPQGETTDRIETAKEKTREALQPKDDIDVPDDFDED